MYKSRIHRYIWFPYQPGRLWLMLLIIILAFLAAAAGVSAKFSIFAQLDLQSIPVPFWLLIAVAAALSVALTAYAARTDYLSAGRALVPSAMAVLLVWLSCLVVINIRSASVALPPPDAAATTASTSGFFSQQWVAQATVATLLFVILVIGFVQSSGVDLSAISGLKRKLEILINKIKETELLTAGALTSTRATLIQHLTSLADQLRQAAGDVHGRLEPTKLAAEFDGFAQWTKGISDSTLIQELKLDRSQMQTKLRSIR
jgi:hypothetical protein